jgi:hypothetical protein
VNPIIVISITKIIAAIFSNEFFYFRTDGVDMSWANSDRVVRRSWSRGVVILQNKSYSDWNYFNVVFLFLVLERIEMAKR